VAALLAFASLTYGSLLGIREQIEASLQVRVLRRTSSHNVAEALVRQGHRTSKLRAFKEPDPDIYV
jgi:hypothetical protein